MGKESLLKALNFYGTIGYIRGSEIHHHYIFYLLRKVDVENFLKIF